jgi:hypothetical protein
MPLPELVRSTLGEEDVIAHVSLRDDDALFISPTKTLQYHGQSLLSDESVEEFPHTAERLAISAGRRKTALELDYGLEGTRKLTIPSKNTDDALHPILAGVLSAAGVTESGETVRETFRFSELTLVVTDSRLIKHVGQSVWDEEYEEFSFAGVSEFAVEEGRVATQFVLTISGRAERIKIPNERARAFRECLEDALCSHHEIESITDLPDPGSTIETKPADETPFEPASVEVSGSPEESAPLYELGERDGEPTPLERLDALENALDTHLELLDEQYRELDQLRTELTRGR